MIRRAVLALVVITPATAIGSEIPDRPEDIVIRARDWAPPSMDAHHHSLSSGAHLLFAPDATLPLVEIVVAIRGGAFLDPSGAEGLTYLTSQMMSRGGAGDRSADEFDQWIAGLGARVSSRFSPAFVAFGLSATGWELEASVDAFHDLLHRPRFDQTRLEDLTGNLREGMSRRNDDPTEVVFREWERLLYGDYAANQALTPADVFGILRSDLRSQHRRLWGQRDVVVAVSGAVDLSTAQRLAERLTSTDQPPEGIVSAPAAWPPPPPGGGVRAGTYRLERGNQQVKVVLGHRLAARATTEEDRWPLVVLAEVLGGSGAVSRIQGRLRTAEGLVYRSSVTLEIGDLWPGEFQVFFETRPGSEGRAAELVLEELRRIRRQPVPRNELEAARKNLLGSVRRSFDTAEERVGYLAENVLYGRPFDYWRDYVAGVRAVTPEDVLRVAADHLRPDALVVLALGPAPAGPDPLASLLDRPVEFLPQRDPLTLEALPTP